jgi:hypothetical protein
MATSIWLALAAWMWNSSSVPGQICAGSGLEGDDRELVHRQPEQGPLLGDDPDDAIGQAADRHVLADRVGPLEQLLRHQVAEHHHRASPDLLRGEGAALGHVVS